MKTVKFRMWSAKAGKYFYDPHVFFECLLQQHNHDCNTGYVSWNHIGDGMVFEQFTGVKDIKGKDVYEGDVILGDLFDKRFPTRGEIVFDERLACYANKNEGGDTPLSSIDKIEVIGNCHGD